MNVTEQWAGRFGDAYTARNRVDWVARIPFWQKVLNVTCARSVYEFGCNAGWNLSAIRRAESDVSVAGCDVNEQALQRALAAGLYCCKSPVRNLHPGAYDLTFTAGVLIHIPAPQVIETMKEVIRLSARYVLAIEYEAEREEEVEYRGQSGMLWRRPFGAMYEALGLTPVLTWMPDLVPGFDNCTAWLLEKR